MSLDHILLLLLEREATGYELKSEFEAGAMTFWPALPSQIYSTLQRMEERGLLTSTRESSTRGPDRRVYARTEVGWTELEAWLRSGPRIGRERFAYLAQLSGIGLLDDPQAGFDFLEQLRRWFRERHAFLEGIEAGLLADQEPEALASEDFFDWAALRMGLDVLDARIRCCTALLETLGRRSPRVDGSGSRERAATASES